MSVFLDTLVQSYAKKKILAHASSKVSQANMCRINEANYTIQAFCGQAASLAEKPGVGLTWARPIYVFYMIMW